jgi:hypothetical protein
MKKIDLDYFKLKLKYLKWERDAIFNNDTVVMSEFFEGDDTDLVEKIKEQLITSLDREIRKVKKIIDIGKETC